LRLNFSSYLLKEFLCTGNKFH